MGRSFGSGHQALRLGHVPLGVQAADVLAAVNRDEVPSDPLGGWRHQEERHVRDISVSTMRSRSSSGQSRISDSDAVPALLTRRCTVP